MTSQVLATTDRLLAVALDRTYGDTERRITYHLFLRDAEPEKAVAHLAFTVRGPQDGDSENQADQRYLECATISLLPRASIAPSVPAQECDSEALLARLQAIALPGVVAPDDTQNLKDPSPVKIAPFYALKEDAAMRAIGAFLSETEKGYGAHTAQRHVSVALQNSKRKALHESTGFDMVQCYRRDANDEEKISLRHLADTLDMLQQHGFISESQHNTAQQAAALFAKEHTAQQSVSGVRRELGEALKLPSVTRVV